MHMSRTVALVALLVSCWSHAGNLDLSTVVPRDTVELTIYNAEDLTLVRETRRLGFRKGINPIQFSWSNTLIDPTSVELRLGRHEDALQLRDITYPHDRPQTLYWNLVAEQDLDAEVEISYFTSGISWQAEYQVIADTEEVQASLDSMVRVTNRSGEAYADASVRLVIGEINLVEEIARLANVSPMDVAGNEQYRPMRNKLARRVMEAEAPMPAAAVAMDGFGAGLMAEPKEIEKEGLGDYFIYRIEGTETIPDGWSLRLRSFLAESVPLKEVFRYRVPQFGDQLMRLYLIENDTDSGLGATPLPKGRVQVFRRSAEGSLQFLAGVQSSYVPIGDTLELELGVDPDVVFELRQTRNFRDNIWMRLHKPAVLQRVDDGQAKKDPRARVEGWDEHQQFVQRLENHTGKAIRLELRRSFAGDVRFLADFPVESKDYQTVEIQLDLEPGEKRYLGYEVITAQDSNAKQSRVRIGG